MGKSWLATRMGIVTETLRRMTIDKIRGIDRMEKELEEDKAKIDAQYKVAECRCCVRVCCRERRCVQMS